MKDTEEQRWHLDRYQRASLYWNNLSNRQVFELNKQLLALATIILPLTASVVVVDTIQLREYEVTLLIFGWVFLFLSIASGLVQIWIDAKYFNYLQNDASTREQEWSQDKNNNEIKKEVRQLGMTEPSSSFVPTLSQVLFIIFGLIIIMSVAVSLLTSSTSLPQQELAECFAGRCPEYFSMDVDGDGLAESVVVIPTAMTQGAGKVRIIDEGKIVFETPEMMRVWVKQSSKDAEVGNKFTLLYAKKANSNDLTEINYVYQDGQFRAKEN